jgi:hypothetical protein
MAIALAAPAGAAPSSINDCEKIEAADAYNQCLALFGPVAHAHGASAKDFGGDGARAGAGADVVQSATPDDSAPAQSGRHGRRGRHAHGRSYAHAAGHAHHQRHGRESAGHYGHSSAHATHAGSKRLAFNVVSGHGKRH